MTCYRGDHSRCLSLHVLLCFVREPLPHVYIVSIFAVITVNPQHDPKRGLVVLDFCYINALWNPLSMLYCVLTEKNIDVYGNVPIFLIFVDLLENQKMRLTCPPYNFFCNPDLHSTAFLISVDQEYDKKKYIVSIYFLLRSVSSTIN